MPIPPFEDLPSRPASRLAWPVLLVALATGAACSLLVDRNPVQCVSDADCEKFGTYPLCQEGVCVPSGLSPPGCVRSPQFPDTPEEIRTQCTTGQCIPFDNCARVGFCDGGVLPALVTPP